MTSESNIIDLTGGANTAPKQLKPEAQAVVDKVIEKIVVITITDGREYVGKIMSVDKTGSVFLQDGLEVIDKSEQAEQECRYFYHELFSPYLITNQSDKVLKYVGNVVIPGKHVKKIAINNKLDAIYNEKEAKLRES